MTLGVEIRTGHKRFSGDCWYHTVSSWVGCIRLGQVISAYKVKVHILHNTRASTETDVDGSCTMVIFISSILGKICFYRNVLRNSVYRRQSRRRDKVLNSYSGGLLFESWPSFLVLWLPSAPPGKFPGWYLDLAIISAFRILSKSKKHRGRLSICLHVTISEPS